jgi:hypothetical protein
VSSWTFWRGWIRVGGSDSCCLYGWSIAFCIVDFDIDFSQDKALIATEVLQKMVYSRKLTYNPKDLRHRFKKLMDKTGLPVDD